MFNYSYINNSIVVEKDLTLEMISICNQFNTNIIYPLIIALLSQLFRWIIVYNVIDSKSKFYNYFEVITDLITAISIVISLVWIIMTKVN